MRLEMIDQLFGFLEEYGYCLIKEESNNCIIYTGKNNKVVITYSEYSCEISCQFKDNQTLNGFSLQDALKYHCANDLRGMYQISDKNDLSKGLSYIAHVIAELYAELDISNPTIFEKVYKYTIEKRKKELDDYHLKEELKKADSYWEKKRFNEAYELYQKNKEHLSRSQFKRMTLCDSGSNPR